MANLLLLMTDEIRLATLLIRRVVPGRQCSTCNLCERLSCLLNRIKMLMAMPQVGEILPPATTAAAAGRQRQRRRRQVIMPPLTRPRPADG